MHFECIDHRIAGGLAVEGKPQVGAGQYHGLGAALHQPAARIQEESTRRRGTRAGDGGLYIELAEGCDLLIEYNSLSPAKLAKEARSHHAGSAEETHALKTACSECCVKGLNTRHERQGSKGARLFPAEVGADRREGGAIGARRLQAVDEAGEDRSLLGPPVGVGVRSDIPDLGLDDREFKPPFSLAHGFNEPLVIDERGSGADPPMSPIWSPVRMAGFSR